MQISMDQNKMGLVLAIFLLSLIIVAFAWLSFWKRLFTKKQQKEKSPVSNSSSKSKSNSKLVKPSESQGKVPNPQPKDEEEELDEEEDDEHGETLCGACGGTYPSDELWILCNFCEKWFHGKCVKITPARAEQIKRFRCPSCWKKKRRL